MQTGLTISLSVGSMAIVMLIASFLFQDKEGAKPARHAFRLFYLFIVLFFIVLVIQDQMRNFWIALAVDICIAVLSASLTVGILWRSQRRFPVWTIYLLALIYILIDTISVPGNIQFAYSINISCSLIGIYGLLKRRPAANAGDIGMACIILLWIIVFAFNIPGLSNVLSKEYYAEFMSDVFIYAPAYLSGLSIFLFSSYMLDAQKALALQAGTDVMTGLYNRRFFISESTRILGLAKRHQYAVSVIICDIDYFKSVNDTYGHEVGDLAIKAFANILKGEVRTGDVLARYGGEEFVVVLPQTRQQAAMVVAERMRVETENLLLNTGQGELGYTASFGIAQASNYDDIEATIHNADTALYKAKTDGRNRVCLFQ